MLPAPADLGRWPSIVSRIAGLVDLEASARCHGALLRRRGVRSAADLLHLALLYGPGGLSLRSAASLAAELGIAELCDVSLLDRLRRSGPWLAAILEQLLADKRKRRPASDRLAQGRFRLVLVDGSTVSSPGSQGSDWRLHGRYEPGRGGFTDLRITQATTAEALHHVALGPGDIVVQDRGYARAANFAHAEAQGSDFITRIGWHSVRLYDAAGKAFDLLAALPAAGEAIVAHAVRIGARQGIPARLILLRKPPAAREAEHRRLRRKASRKGQAPDPRTIRAVGFVMLLTSLPAEDASAAEVAGLYRLRWQIELAFKRLKSLAGFDALRADDPDLVRAWLLAHLIAVVLIEDSLAEDLDPPP